jgi:hypothetical protein
MTDCGFCHLSFILLSVASGNIMAEPDGAPAYSLPVLQVFGLFCTLVFFVSRNLLGGIMAALTGILSAFWILSLLEDGRPEGSGIWAYLLLLQWIILMLAVIRKRHQKRYP